MQRKKTHTAGFTLVEMIVAVALFAVVMLVSVSTLLALVNANRKAQALQSVINNLNIALDGLVRSARMGSVYHGAGGAGDCGDTNYSIPHDCASGGSIFSFEPYGNTTSDPSWVYVFDSETRTIKKSTNGTTIDAVPITAPEVTIDDMKFYVVGTTRGDEIQPKVVIIIKGSAGTANSVRTTFHIQATAVQRSLDI
jgi:prepilin-type N-terminal cleavage/methylation domain-containing protein